ncbi:MAG: hypothetical protein AUK03_16590 [Anaerolineae bacterium CG2_30_64_16]|nr:MAG: hypothetical protein AUK03_16590 [Anaerolineae bacterium CG2_30_64_16]
MNAQQTKVRLVGPALILSLILALGMVSGSAAGPAPGSTLAPAAPQGSTDTITFQGQLTDSAGNPLDGAYDMRFTIYDAETGGSAAWGAETQIGVQVANGLFVVQLGSVIPLGATVFDGGDRWLQIEVWNGAAWEALTPRLVFGSAAYAINAQSVEGLSAGLFVRKSGDDMTGALGVSVGAAGSGAIHAENTASADGSTGIAGVSSAASGSTNGGYFESQSINGVGVVGSVSATYGATIGVYGETGSSSDEAVGVYGLASRSSGKTYGVMGETASSGSEASGVYGLANASSGETNGGYFESKSSAGIGVQGIASANGGKGTVGVIGVTMGNQPGGLFGEATPMGVYGVAQSASGVTYGVEGLTWSNTDAAAGVHGLTVADSGKTYGVLGETFSSGSEASGVYGLAHASKGDTYGGYFESKSSAGIGVLSIASASGGEGTIGVVGVTKGNQPGGLFGEATPVGVYGVAESASGVTYGVEGATWSSTDAAAGVHGLATADSGLTYGVYGETLSDSKGVAGVHGFSSDGTTYGVMGQTLSADSDGAGVFGDALSSAAGGRFESLIGPGIRTKSSTGNPIEAYNAGGLVFKVDNSGNVFADGTYTSPAADFAELLPAVEGLEPGDVLTVGPDGRVNLANADNVLAIIGVYSTNPAFLGGKSFDDAQDKSAIRNPQSEIPVAIIGVVPVKVNAENGPIRPNDPLTVSKTASGHAAKAIPLFTLDGGEAVYAGGTIVGRALEGLDSGTGVIRVLLQLR